jgi:short-subunit dehydrogenase
MSAMKLEWLGPRTWIADTIFMKDNRAKSSMSNLLLMSGVSFAAALIYRVLKGPSHSPKKTLDGKKVLITGGSRGLGLALAQQYAQYGAKIFICARKADELEEARKKLESLEVEVMTYTCDITDQQQVHRLVHEVESTFGTIDILINNAGIMEVGPLEEFDIESFQRVIDINLVGMIRMTLCMVPRMRQGSRIINITSIGAAVSVPHMLPYSVSKFGTLGFSLGLDAELATRGISVTTILPGLMRTGSFVHAVFHGKAQKEFDWFALGASLPLVSISAQKAVMEIISGGQKRKRFVVLGPQAKVIRHLYQIVPESSLSVMRAIAHLLPSSPGDGLHESRTGTGLRKDLPKGGITRLGDRAGDELNENRIA